MKTSSKEIERFVRHIFHELKKADQIIFKTPEDKVFQRAIEIVRAEFKKEADLDVEVNRMLDDLEKQHQGEFQRYKMFPLLKKKLAKERGLVL